MDYFKLLNLETEPFSNSPDPAYFFQSRQHQGCLQQLELSLRLRRGLCVVIGDVGTGKTTLCRQIIRKFSEEETETHLILDPSFSSPSEFLLKVAEMFLGRKPAGSANDWQLKEIIKHALFQKGVDEDKTIILIIDEGQKIPLFCLEILREFLNYETNEYKLLQIAIFAQKEFEYTLNEHANLADRINLKYFLGPINFRDLRALIRYRIKKSSPKGAKIPALFTLPALWAIYRASGGYPRKIINLCHQSLLAMIIQNRSKVGWPVVRSCFKRTHTEPPKRWLSIATAVSLVFLLVVLTAGIAPDLSELRLPWPSSELKKANLHKQSRIIRIPIPKPERRVETALPKGPAIATESDRNVRDDMLSENEKSASEENRTPVVIEEVIPASHAENLVKKVGYPPTLGKVTLMPNETLWRLTEKVYGEFKKEYFKILMGANPKITDPDLVAIGQRISVPAIPMKPRISAEKCWWVEINNTDDLDTAVDFLRSYPEDAPLIRSIPYWNDHEGFHVSVLLRKHFADETSARHQLSKLPFSMAVKGKLLSRWDASTVFFADPYLIQ